MADKDLEQMVLDDDTIAQMAKMWFDENEDVFEEAGVDLEGGWTGEPPEELDAIAEDAAADIVDQLRNPDDGSGGIAIMNPLDDLVDGIYFVFAEATADSPEDYEGWLETLSEEEDEEEGGEDEPVGADEAEDEVEGDEEVDYEP
jgi:hypothetical protein